jgi:AcrR family transcriptional regulator
MPKALRVRRTPEEARRLILDASLRLFAHHGPDATGLKEVAREAGVSHALITHYFGTYDALVEAAFADHARRSRADVIAHIAELSGEGPRGWIKLAARQFQDPLYGRLAIWALLSGRVDHADFFPRRDQGFRKVADAIEMRFAFQGKKNQDRADIEFFTLLVLSSLMGYHLGRRLLWAGLGKDSSAARDDWFHDRLASLAEWFSETAPKRRRRPKRPGRSPSNESEATTRR